MGCFLSTAKHTTDDTGKYEMSGATQATQEHEAAFQSGLSGRTREGALGEGIQTTDGNAVEGSSRTGAPAKVIGASEQGKVSGQSKDGTRIPRELLAKILDKLPSEDRDNFAASDPDLGKFVQAFRVSEAKRVRATLVGEKRIDPAGIATLRDTLNALKEHDLANGTHEIDTLLDAIKHISDKSQRALALQAIGFSNLLRLNPTQQSTWAIALSELSDSEFASVIAKFKDAGRLDANALLILRSRAHRLDGASGDGRAAILNLGITSFFVQGLSA